MLIIGAGGFALESLEILFQNNYQGEISFFDNVNDEINPYIINNYKVIRNFDELSSLDKNSEFILGVGNPIVRKLLHDKLTKEYSLVASSIISNKSTIGVIENLIGDSVNIMSGVVITSQCVIKDGVLINLNTTIGHNTIIEEFVEICPGVSISGNCYIEKGAFIGTGAIILPNVRIGKGAVIAAGAIVTKDIAPNFMYAGNPAVLKKEVKNKW